MRITLVKRNEKATQFFFIIEFFNFLLNTSLPERRNSLLGVSFADRLLILAYLSIFFFTNISNYKYSISWGPFHYEG